MIIIEDNITDLPQEEWRAVAGYGGKYMISNMGRTKSLKWTEARILTPFVNNKGYARVCLCRNGKGRYFLVSRLVAEAFCENPDPSRCTVVDHIDGNTLNNRSDNLQWLSMSENTRKEWHKYDAEQLLE